MSSKYAHGKVAAGVTVDSHLVVGFITDIEGNIDHWNRYLNTSSVLYRSEEGEDDRILMRGKNSHFVYGGDVMDRGAGDIRVLRELVELKERYPQRVHLLIGNRDVNKLRLPSALNEQVLTMTPWAYWANEAIASIDHDTAYYFSDASCKMKWLLTHSMGSPFAFEYRREELIQMQLPNSDDDVTDSFLALVSDSSVFGGRESEDTAALVAACCNSEGVGWMLRYLELAQVAVIIGDTIYVHGAFNEDNIGWVPDTKAMTFKDYMQRTAAITGGDTVAAINQNAETFCKFEGKNYDDPLEWCRAINAFAAQEVRDYRERNAEYLRLLSKAIQQLQENVLSSASTDNSVSAEVSRRLKLLAPDAIEGELGEGDEATLLPIDLSDDVQVIICDTPPRSWNNRSGASTPQRKPSFDSRELIKSALNAHDGTVTADSGSTFMDETRTVSLATCSADEEADAAIRRRLLFDEVGGYYHPQPGSRLVQYGMSLFANKQSTKSVIYAKFKEPVSETTAQWLKRGNIRKVITGHQPSGDSPSIMDQNGIQVITVDTSFSKHVRWPESQLMALNRHEPSSMGMNTPMGLSEAIGDILQEDNSKEEKTLKSLYKNTPHYNSFTDTGERNRNATGGQNNSTSAQLVDGIGALDLDLDDIPMLEGADDIDLDDSSNSSPMRKPRSSMSALLPPRHTGSNTNLLNRMSPLPRAPPATPLKMDSVAGGIAAAIPPLPLPVSNLPSAPMEELSPPQTKAAAPNADEINWMTFEEFEQKFGTARFVEPLAALTTLTFTPRGTVADAAIPSTAETRGRHCHSEAILAFRGVGSTSSVSSGGSMITDCVDLSSYKSDYKSRTYIRGRTAQRSTYDFELKASNENRFVGKMTPHNWLVKLSDVKAPSKPKALKGCDNSWDSMDSLIEESQEEQVYYLLTKVEGRNVNNRLVPSERIAKEFDANAVLDTASLAV